MGLPAARVGDQIAHTMARFGMIAGALIGLAAGALLVGATIATGGAALAVTAAVGGAMGLTSFGGLTGLEWGAAQMGPPCGAIVMGALTVMTNFRPQAHTVLGAAACAKEGGTPIPIATGSGTVMVCHQHAARESDQIGCSAKILKGSNNVVIGGPSVQVLPMKPEVPAWAVQGLQVLGIAGAVLALPYAIATVGVAGTVGGALGGMVGAHYGGKGMEALGRRMGMAEHNLVLMRAAGEFGGGMAGGYLGMRGAQSLTGRSPSVRPFQKGDTDPARRVMGPARQSHPDELAAMRADMRRSGVKINERPGRGDMAYMPNSKSGKPGTLTMDPDASYAAWRHEYRHFTDDRASGFQGMKALLDNNTRWRWEQAAYADEMSVLRRAGHHDVVPEVMRLRTGEWNNIFRRGKPW